MTVVALDIGSLNQRSKAALMSVIPVVEGGRAEKAGQITPAGAGRYVTLNQRSQGGDGDGCIAWQ